MYKTHKIGVAGCGRMGLPMLQNLQAAGFNAVGFDVRDVGVETNIDAFADGLATLITVVRDATETDALLFDDQALVTRAKDLQTIIISSTLSPRYISDIKQKIPAHITLIDAPMSGAQVRARAGTLAFMVGGTDGDIASNAPIFDCLGSDLHHMGAYGAGMTAKVLNNLLAASSTAMTRLVLDWADTQGLDEQKLLTLINTASGQNWLASGFNDIEFARDGYSTDNSIGILEKDISAALDIAPENADCTLPETVQRYITQLNPRNKT